MTESISRFFEHLGDRLSPLEESDSGFWQLDAGSGKSTIDLREDPVGLNTIYIAFVETDLAHRRKGHATELIQVVCNIADLCRVDLSLRVEDIPDSDNDALVSWYQRLGFAGDRDEMIRVHK